MIEVLVLDSDIESSLSSTPGLAASSDPSATTASRGRVRARGRCCRGVVEAVNARLSSDERDI
jgi:hypothetical protein